MDRPTCEARLVRRACLGPGAGSLRERFPRAGGFDLFLSDLDAGQLERVRHSTSVSRC
jgi:hypothetical protein